MIETGNFNSSDSTKLFYRALPVEKGRIPVVITHGFAEHSGRYGEVMSELHENGFAPLAFDLRGHGHSEGRRGYISSFQDYVNDLKSAVNFALERNKAEHVLLLAHSMGGLIAAHYGVSEPEKVLGMVISSPLFGIRIQVPRWKKELGHLMSKYWPSFSMPNQIDANLLTHDTSKAEAYRTDPLIFHHVCARWFEEIAEKTENSSESAKKLKVPFLLQLAEDDHIVSFEKSCEWYANTVSADRSQRTYPGFYHEIYNETERAKPIGDFISWMQERWPLKKAPIATEIRDTL
jgi:acylglycerol lipase